MEGVSGVGDVEAVVMVIPLKGGHGGSEASETIDRQIDRWYYIFKVK